MIHGARTPSPQSLSAEPRPTPPPALLRLPAPPFLTRRSLLLATTASTLPWWRLGSNTHSYASAVEAPPPLSPLTPVAVPRGASPTEALREALVGRGLDRVALVLEPGVVYDGGLVVDRESREYGAPPPQVSVLVDGGGNSGNSGAPAAATATLRLETKSPYARVLEVRGGGVFLRAENLRIVHSSKSVASNYAVLASAGAELELANCDVSSSTGAGVAADGAGRCVLVKCTLANCARQGLAAFGGSRDTTAQGPAFVRLLDGCRVERNGGDGVLVRDGAAVVLEGGCVVEGNQGAGVRWFVLEEREAEAALAVAASEVALIGGGVRFGRNKGPAVAVDTGGGAGDDRAAEALAAALRRGISDEGLVAVV